MTNNARENCVDTVRRVDDIAVLLRFSKRYFNANNERNDDASRPLHALLSGQRDRIRVWCSVTKIGKNDERGAHKLESIPQNGIFKSNFASRFLIRDQGLNKTDCKIIEGGILQIRERAFPCYMNKGRRMKKHPSLSKFIPRPKLLRLFYFCVIHFHRDFLSAIVQLLTNINFIQKSRANDSDIEQIRFIKCKNILFVDNTSCSVIMYRASIFQAKYLERCKVYGKMFRTKVVIARITSLIPYNFRTKCCFIYFAFVILFIFYIYIYNTEIYF